MSRFNRLRLLSLPVPILLVVWAAPALAADPAPAQVEEVVVTGSLLTTKGFEAPSPTTVLSIEELELTAPRNLIDGLATLPALISSSSAKTGASSGGSPQAGSYLNLRNLGVARTLVLLDGRRLPPSAATGASDINLIPQSLASRVDLVTGGASATYGSDAVAGVVNIVLNRAFTGVSGTVEGGVSDYGDAVSYKGELNGGWSFADGRGHFIASFAHAQQSPVYSEDARPWAAMRYGEVTIPGNSPLHQILPNVNQIATHGGVIVSGPLANTQFLPGGIPAPYDPGTIKSSVNVSGGDAQGTSGTLSALVRTDNVFAHGEYDITDNFTVFLEASANESHNRYAIVYPFEYGATAFTIFSGNPFIPSTIQAQMAAKNVASFTLHRISKDMDFSYADFLNRSYNVVGGFKGGFGASWSYNFYFEHGETTSIVHTDKNAVQEHMYAAADAVINPANGQIVCRVALTNPGLYPGCTPINLFGEGAPTQQALNYVLGSTYYRPTLKQNVADFSLRGEPFSTWAGPVGVAVGAEYRTESIAQVADAISQQVKTAVGIRGFPASLLNVIGGYSLTNQQPFAGSYNIHEAFGEILVPLAKGLPFAQSADFNAAVRYTDYSTSGGVTTWKIGLNYQPIADIHFRTTLSHDIRAANLSELYSGNIQGQGSITDPTLANAVYTIFTSAQGNLGLKPEKATTVTGGVVFQPQWLPGFDASIDYFDISINGAIQSITSQQTVDQCQAGSSVACANIIRGSDGRIQKIILPFINFASLKTSGFDLEVGFRRPLSDLVAGWNGRFDIRAFANYISKFTTQTPGAPPQGFAGEIGRATGGNPRFQGMLRASYVNDPLTIFVQERYISSGLYNATYVEGVTVNNNHIPSRAYTDVTAQYRFEVGKTDLTAFVTINNLFDQDPALTAGGGGTNTSKQTNDSLYDKLGRYYTAGIRYKF